MKKAFTLLAVGGLLCSSLVACGDDDETTTPVETTAECSATVTAKESLGASASFQDATEMAPPDDSVDQSTVNMSGKYRTNLAQHPGCKPRDSYDGNSEPLAAYYPNDATVPAGSPAQIADYPCAAVEWTQDNENTDLPIVILVHGNSTGVPSFVEYHNASIAGSDITTYSSTPIHVDSQPREMIVTKLLAEGYRVYGFDARTDIINTKNGDNEVVVGNGNNAYDTMDHGWAVPMLQQMIKAVINANPTRQIVLAGHSLGVTEIRDALRRLFVEFDAGTEGAVNPFPHIQDVVFWSGANHGVAGGATGCSGAENMTSTVFCELGDRNAYGDGTYFENPFNGPSDVFSTPCADGDYAFGKHDVCDGHVVRHTTVVMQDLSEGSFQDEFVSEASAKLSMDGCVENKLIGLGDYDTSGYFLKGLYGNHFGTPRSDTGMAYFLARIGAN